MSSYCNLWFPRYLPSFICFVLCYFPSFACFLLSFWRVLLYLYCRSFLQNCTLSSSLVDCVICSSSISLSLPPDFVIRSSALLRWSICRLHILPSANSMHYIRCRSRTLLYFPFIHLSPAPKFLAHTTLFGSNPLSHVLLSCHFVLLASFARSAL